MNKVQPLLNRGIHRKNALLYDVLSPQTRHASSSANKPKSRAAIIKTLQQAFEDEGLSGFVRGRVSRHADIVSEKLCNDAIEYIAPSLEAYKGATIVDVNPGPCVWSRCLHEYLKPKHHILMEPDKRYKPFIEPLIRMEGSRYRHVALAGVHEKSYWSNWQQILKDPTIMPPRESLANDDPRLTQLDTTFLVTGNLWRYGRVSRQKNAVKLAPLIMSQTTWAAHTHELFHNAGMVRMLWWLPEEELPELIARDTSAKQALSVALDLTSDVKQIVGCQDLSDMQTTRAQLARREGTEKFLTRTVQERMSSQGISPPKGRNTLAPAALSSESDIEPGLNPLATSCSTCEDVEKLLAMTRQKRREALVIVAKGSRQPLQEKLATLRSQLVYHELLDVFMSIDGRKLNERPRLLAQSALMADLLIQQIHIEAEWDHINKALPGQSERLAALHQEVVQAGKELDAIFERIMYYTSKGVVKTHVEHIIMRHTTPDSVMRDARPFEPLKASPSEVWPANRMALLDVTPRTFDISLPGLANAREAVMACRELIKHLYIYPSMPITNCLDRLAPNAAQDLIPLVPDIFEVQKGGRLDPTQLMTRLLRREAIVHLTHAFLEWPFRPETWQLALAAQEAEVLAAEASAKTETDAQVASNM